MVQTYTYFIIILLGWGLWGFLGKYALKFINPYSLLLYEVIGSIIINLIVLIVLWHLKPKIDTNTVGMSMAMLSAFVSVIAAVIFYFTLSKTKASILVPLTALYPIVTLMLSFVLLKERVTLTQGIGIVLAIIAGVLLSI